MLRAIESKYSIGDKRVALKRSIAALRMGDSIKVDTSILRNVALNCARELFQSGLVKFKLSTRRMADGEFELRAVKP